MSEVNEENEQTGHSWTFLCIYIASCIMLVFWLIYKFFKGRNQMRLAFVTIEQQLQKMQQQLENRNLEEQYELLKNANLLREDDYLEEEKISKSENEERKAKED